MKLDYLLRMQKKFEGEYSVFFDKKPSLSLPYITIGTWKLTKEGREAFKDLLGVEVNRVVTTNHKELYFELKDDEQAERMCRFLWLAYGVGDINSYEKYIEKET